MVREVEIIYEEPFEDWKERLKKGLEEQGIAYDDTMLKFMCASINTAVTKYLVPMGYRPKSTLQYRKGLIARFNQEGLTLSIKTNRIFWKYLEYFTDIEDYSKCFDLDIKIFDYEKATKDMIFVGVNTNNTTGIVKHPKFSEEYASVTRKLDLLKTMLERDVDLKIMKEMATQIVDILDFLIRRTD